MSPHPLSPLFAFQQPQEGPHTPSHVTLWIEVSRQNDALTSHTCRYTENCGPWAIPILLPVTVNKIVLEY